MSIHIYKYGLQWIYGCNVSSSIDDRFYTYCAHFLEIDNINACNAIDNQNRMWQSDMEQEKYWVT